MRKQIDVSIAKGNRVDRNECQSVCVGGGGEDEGIPQKSPGMNVTFHVFSVVMTNTVAEMASFKPSERAVIDKWLGNCGEFLHSYSSRQCCNAIIRIEAGFIIWLI